MGLTCVIAREHFTSFAFFTNIGATEAIPMIMRTNVALSSCQQGDRVGRGTFHHDRRV
jgi:hypothetical protein